MESKDGLSRIVIWYEKETIMLKLGKNVFEENLKCLINKKFNCISRACDMLCLFVGDNYAFVSRGREINVADFSLHIQTQWRLTSFSKKSPASQAGDELHLAGI